MNKKHKAILFIILSAFCFSLMNMFVKLSGDVPSIQKSFFRNLVAAGVATFLLYRSNTSFHWQKGNLKYLILRSSFGTIGILCNFYALSNMNLADASMLNKLSPFFAIFFSYLFLKEKVTPTQVICMIAAFMGSLFIIKPTFTVFFFSAFSCLAVLPYIVFNYAPMTIYQLAMLIMAGICGSGGQFAITAAYANAPASEISIYDYTIVIFAAIWSFLLWNDMPDMLSFIGYAIIFGASFCMFLKNKSK